MRILGLSWILSLGCAACAANPPGAASLPVAGVAVSGRAVLGTGPCGTPAPGSTLCQSPEEPAPPGLVFSFDPADVAGPPVRVTTGNDGLFSARLRPGRYTAKLETRSINLEFEPTTVSVPTGGVNDVVLRINALRQAAGPAPQRPAAPAR